MTGLAQRATSFDIAELAGVSQPTVSRALRNSPMVSEQTRNRILTIARQLNYRVDKAASSLRRQQTRTLALLFFEDPTPDESLINPFFLSMLGPITRACAGYGYDLLISFQQLSSDWHVDFEDSRRADGIILLGYGDYDAYHERLEQLIRQGTHFVRWGLMQPGVADHTLGCDNFDGGKLAASHLHSLGRRKLAFLGGADSSCPEFRDRYLGAEAAWRCSQPDAAPIPRFDAISTEASGYSAAKAMLESGGPADAVFCASDLIAIGAMRAFADAGRRVPEDISVVGFDDLPAASLTSPPLTTVQQDFLRAGQMLVDSLVRQINGEPAPASLLPARLVVRRSCGATT